MRRNVKLVVAYNGRAYHGWQRQAEGIDTIQERIERAAGIVVGHPVIAIGAGRTDAGVHAAGQVANFLTTNRAIPLENLRRAMNSRLPADIAAVSAAEAPGDFHASCWAIGKTYRYRIHVSPVRPVELAGLVYHFWRPLDVPAMQRAAARLTGTHDFRGLATSADQRQDTIRTIYRCEVAGVGPEVLITVRGGGFLYNMVRNIAGTLIEIGRGRWPPERIDQILASCNRQDAGPLVPPDGLTLVCVHYPPEDISDSGGVR